MGRKLSGVQAVSATSIQIDFRYKGRRFRERLPLEPTPANLKKAAKFKASIELAIFNGTFDYAVTFPHSKHAKSFGFSSGQVSLENYLEHWLEQKEPVLKASTLEGYRKIINGVLIPNLGHIPLIMLSRKDIRSMLSKFDASNKRLLNIQSCLRSALNHAVDDEMIEINPLAGWSYTVKERPKTEDQIDPFTQQEQAAILAAAIGQYKNFLQFALWTGLRTSELIALQWNDIDWLRNEVRISKAKTSAAKEAELPKTASGMRDVKLLPPALDALENQKEYTYPIGEEVFHDPRYEQPYTGDQVLRKSFWIPTLKKAGVRYRNPYQTRHTYASMMLTAGEHPMWVAKQMGHRDWTMIARIYGRWIPSENDTSGDKAVALFSDAVKD